MAAAARCAAPLLIETSPPRVLFAELVAGALDRTGVTPSAQACAYLVDLLSDCLVPLPVPLGADGTHESLAEGLLRARCEGRRERAARLRTLGDRALFRSGFFADSLEGWRQPGEWVREAGRMAYAELSCLVAPRGWQRARLFEELADCFEDFAEVLTEVGDDARAGCPAGLVSLTDRYLRMARERDRLRLQRRGLVVPGEAAERIQ